MQTIKSYERLVRTLEGTQVLSVPFKQLILRLALEVQREAWETGSAERQIVNKMEFDAPTEQESQEGFVRPSVAQFNDMKAIAKKQRKGIVTFLAKRGWKNTGLTYTKADDWLRPIDDKPKKAGVS